MKISCAYHPTLPALWTCPRCNKNLCSKCIDKRVQGFPNQGIYYFCPKCNVMLGEPDISGAIVPFWNRLHQFFAYPFKSWHSIGFIIGTGILSLLTTKVGFLGLLGAFVLWAVMLKYSFEALRATTMGDFQPPKLDGRVLSENFHLVFKQILLFILIFFIFLRFVAPLGIVPVFAFMLAGFLMMPAMIIILTINDNLVQAINPVYFFGMVFRIGPAYLLMFFFLALLYIAPAVLGSYVIEYLPSGLQIIFISAAKNYYTLVSYHLMGYVIFQYHERLNYDIDTAAFLATSVAEKMTGPVSAAVAPALSTAGAILLKEARQMTQDGNLDEAIQLIQRRADLANITDFALSEHYVKLLKVREKKDELLSYAPNHLDLLTAANEKESSVALYSECLGYDVDFMPSAKTLFKLGGWFNSDGHNKQAIIAYNKMIKKYPKDPLIPKTLFSAAQIFNEKLNNKEKAKQILNMLLQRYPGHELIPYVQMYLNKI